MFWQYQKTYQDGCQLVIVHTHDGFIVLPYYEIRLLGTKIQYPSQSDYLGAELTSPSAILLKLNTRLETEKYQFDKSLV